MTVYQLGGLHPETVFVPSVLDRYLISRTIQFFNPSEIRDIESLRYPHTTRTLILNDSDREYLMSQVTLIRREMAEVGADDFLRLRCLPAGNMNQLEPPVHRSSASEKTCY